MYSQDLIDAVLQHADIVKVVSSFIPVIKAGRAYKAVCPFHDDTNPSLTITPEKRIFKCFACGAGGNAIKFVEKFEKISFPEAVRKTAELCNFSDPRLVADVPKIQIDPERKKLYDCINDLQDFYRYSIDIPEGAEARQYLDGRELTSEIRVKYGIGYAPLDGQMTVRYLQAKGHSLKAIEDIGIALMRGTATSDSNAGRVMFPLRDPNGQVVGFSARRIRDDGTAKYINSPENSLFVKRNVLYNYHNVVGSAHRDGYCYVLEGFMDVIALDKAGVPNAVALMGTALTERHIALLKRLNCEIRLCLDGDEAGQKAMLKACDELNAARLPFRIVDYGDDLRDPDEILREDGKEALLEKLRRLVDPVDFQLAYYTKGKKIEDAAERKRILGIFIPTLKTKGAGIEFEDMLVKLSQATGYQPEAIREFARQAPSQPAPDEQGFSGNIVVAPTSRVGLRPLLSRLEYAERAIVHYMLKKREAIDYFEENITALPSGSILTTISDFVTEYAMQHEGDVDLSGLLAFIDASEFPNRDEIGNEVASIDLDATLPAYSLEAIGDCAQILSDETISIHDKMVAKHAIEEGSVEDGAQANKELAAKIRQRWASKAKKKG
ncbi:MAG: DNA primase [Bacilli bacterium]|nr:DNA primase [Bacilli bacterium]